MIPVTLAAPHEAIAPHRYVVLLRDHACLHCGLVHTTRTTFAETWLRTQPGVQKASPYVRNLRPLHEPPRYNIPIAIIQADDDFTLPFCDNCAGSLSLTHLPRPQDNKPRMAPNWVATGRAPEAHVAFKNKNPSTDKNKAPAKTKAQPKRATTLDDAFNI